jgi:hypothetical protein
VEVIRVAPLGDPIDVKIKGYHLSCARKSRRHRRDAVGASVSTGMHDRLHRP